MENKRILEIVRILLQQTDYITIQKITTLLQVSNKTVRNELDTVAEYLTGYNLTLSRKTGVGIRIEGEEKQKLTLLKAVSQRSSQLADYSPKARKNYIGLRLITCTENCRIYELASELYVSRATIHKDISLLSGQLPPYHINLIRKNNNGISIEGKERHLRDLMFDLMLEDNGYAEFLKIIQDPSYECKNDFIFKALDYTDRDIHKLVQMVIRSKNHYINSLPFNSLSTALLRIFISLVRISEGHMVSLSDEFMENVRAEPLFPEISHLASILAQEYHLTFPEEELRYLQVHFLSLQNKLGISESDQEELEELVNDLLTDWEQIFHRPFTQDQDLRESLTAHLGPALTRFCHGIAIENPMMDEIYAHYQNTFNIAKKSLRIVEERFSGQLSNDEIGYIAIHLAAALDRTNQPLKTILVCHGGTGASKLLIRKLTTQIPEITIIGQESFLTIQQADLTEAELIISTLELSLDTDIPILIINPLMYDYDILRLKEIIKKYYKDKNSPLRFTNVQDLPQ
ncbi:MAG: transcription antiterminator [Clostridiales bacterium]|nr:transcription antiterminator [Clostridiales bacterium]